MKKTIQPNLFRPPQYKALYNEHRQRRRGRHLLFHYHDAQEAYPFVRVFVAAYVWLTGFGNFAFFYTKV